MTKNRFRESVENFEILKKSRFEHSSIDFRRRIVQIARNFRASPAVTVPRARTPIFGPKMGPKIFQISGQILVKFPSCLGSFCNGVIGQNFPVQKTIGFGGPWNISDCSIRGLDGLIGAESSSVGANQAQN